MHYKSLFLFLISYFLLYFKFSNFSFLIRIHLRHCFNDNKEYIEDKLTSPFSLEKPGYQYWLLYYWLWEPYWLIGLVGRVFANCPGDLGSIPGRVIPKTQKMVLDATLLNTQQYKVCIKSKVEQSRERSSALPYTYWKGSLLVGLDYSHQLYFYLWEPLLLLKINSHLFSWKSLVAWLIVLFYGISTFSGYLMLN